MKQNYEKKSAQFDDVSSKLQAKNNLYDDFVARSNK